MHKIVLGFVVWITILSNVLLAQDFSWEDIGRDNLNCQSILVNRQDNRIIFAGKRGNILKTDNAGQSWRRVLSVKGSFTDINVLEAENDDSNVIYAATGNGLYRSLNLGERWERIFRGKNNQENQCTAVGIKKQMIILGTKTGIFISRDSGRSWYKQRSVIDDSAILNIECGSGQSDTIYLAAESGVFRSQDAGQNWERIFVAYGGHKAQAEPVLDDADSSETAPKVYFVKADRNNSSSLYFSSVKGVYKSLDQGKSWEKLTEYGLLNSEVKMLCLSDSSEIFALTASGIFIYTDQRWLEVSFGLGAGRLSNFILDNYNNIYVTGEKGIYKSKCQNSSGFKHNLLIDEYLKDEPSIKEVQAAAIRYAEVSPEKISQWRKDAAKKALFPQISIGLDRNSTDLWHWESGSTTKNDDDSLRRGRDNLDWDITLSWDLSDWVWNDAQTSIDARSKLMVELRNDLLDQVDKLYFERLRVKSELDDLGIEDRRKRFEKQLKLQELTASLDALTCGYYSEQLRLPVSKGT